MPVALDLKHELGNPTKRALHPSRMEKMVFVRYCPPPSNLNDRAEYDMWLESINYICDDLHWLLQQPHDKFWCQIVFDEGLHKALDSFLRYCPRTQDAVNVLPDSGRQKQVELCRLVFMTFLRMSTHKESKECFITPSVFGDILYENFLFDIPKILDICALFGKNNSSILSKMIGNIFTQQPKYTYDLKETVPTIVQVFANIASQCGVKLDSSTMSPQKLDNKFCSGIGSKMACEEFQDLVIYLNDTCTTLHRFLEVYPEGCQVFHEVQFHSLLATFYEGVIPALMDYMKQGDVGTSETRKKILIRLRHCKLSLLSIFHLIMNHVCLQPILENGHDDALVTSKIEEFLHIMTSVLNERRFLAAYEGLFVFQDDVDLLLQASSCVDASQFEYIQSAINSAFATFGRRKSPHGDTNTGGRTSPDGAADSGVAPAGKAFKPSSISSSLTTQDRATLVPGGPPPPYHLISEAGKEMSASALQPSDVELESLICAVKDILPHLGDGFVEMALEEMGWDQEKVISSVLEDSLPTVMKGISPDLPRQQRAVNQGDGQTGEMSLVDSRKNVFDHDDFDVFHSKNVKVENMHQGKQKLKVKQKDENVNEIVRARYNNYGSWEKKDDVDDDSKEASLMYDDEYDDTYDTTNVGADDADSADELLNKTMPRVLMDLERKKAKMEGRLEAFDDNDDSDEDDDDDNGTKRDEFVADPAKLREQAAQRRQTQASRGGRRSGPPRNFDVKGGPKGQGQSKDVLNNRKSKEKFKGQRNKANADKKMSKGMF